MINLRDQRGITLIELAIVAVIMGVLMLGIHNVFSTQDQAARATSLLAEMNQNLRVAQYWLSRDMRVAGYRIEDHTTTSGVGPLSAIGVTDNDPNPDQIDILYAESDPTGNLTTPMPNASAVIWVDDVGDIQENDLIIITDGMNTSLFQVTAVNPVNGLVQHNPGVGPPDCNDPGGHGTFPGYGVGAQLFKVIFHSYRVGTVNGIPCLQVDFHDGEGWQTLAEYIENLNITPAADNSPSYNLSIGARTSLQARIFGGFKTKTVRWDLRPRNIP